MNIKKGVGRNSIFCTNCDAYVHKKCKRIKVRLVDIPDFKCDRCLGLARPIYGRPVENVTLGDQKLEVVESFVCLGDGISPNGGCEVRAISRIHSAWGKFRELLPLSKNQAIPLRSRGKIYNSCIHSVMLYGSECWALTTADVQRLQRNECAMIRWIWKSKVSDKISSDSLLNKLCLENLVITLRTNRLRWFGHVCRSECCIKKCTQHEVVGKGERGRPRKIWQQCLNCDLKSLKLSKDLISNCNARREALRMSKSPTRKTCGT